MLSNSWSRVRLRNAAIVAYEVRQSIRVSEKCCNCIDNTLLQLGVQALDLSNNCRVLLLNQVPDIFLRITLYRCCWVAMGRGRRGDGGAHYFGSIGLPTSLIIIEVFSGRRVSHKLKKRVVSFAAICILQEEVICEKGCSICSSGIVTDGNCGAVTCL